MNPEDFQNAGKVYSQMVYVFRIGHDNSFSKEALTEMYERVVAQGQKVFGLRFKIPEDIQSWAKKNLVKTPTGTESVQVQAKTEPVPAKTPATVPVQAKTPAPIPVGMSSAMAWAQQHQNKPVSSPDRIQSLASQKLINVRLIRPGQEQKPEQKEQEVVKPVMQQTNQPYKSTMEKLLERIKSGAWSRNTYSETGTREGYIKAVENQIRYQKQNGPCSRKSTPIWTPEMDRLLISGLHDRLADVGIGYQHMLDHARKLGYLFKYGHVLELKK